MQKYRVEWQAKNVFTDGEASAIEIVEAKSLDNAVCKIERRLFEECLRPYSIEAEEVE